MDKSADFFVGETASLSRTVSAADVEAFAGITGDTNPVHLDEAYAATTRFHHRIAHGMLAASYISALLGTRFPGPGTIYVSQSLTFLRPVYLGDAGSERDRRQVPAGQVDSNARDCGDQSAWRQGPDRGGCVSGRRRTPSSRPLRRRRGMNHPLVDKVDIYV